MLVNITMDKLTINNYKKLEEVYVNTTIKEYGTFYSIITNKRKYKLERYPNSNGKFEISNDNGTTIEVSIDKLHMDGLMSIIIILL